MMAIVDNRNVSLEGRKIGVHPIVTLILITVLLILMTVPTYHMMNALGSVFDPDSLLAYFIIGVVAFSVSTIEPMLSQSIYHNEGTSNHARKDIAGRFWLILCVIFVTAMGGWSHDVTTSKLDIATTSHNTKSRTFADDLKTIELEYQAGMAKAKTDAEFLALDIKRRKARSKLNSQYSQHQAGAVSERSPMGRLASSLLYCLFSLIVSVATITYSRFILRFSLSITEIPIIDYISKLGQDWTTGKAEGSNNIIDHGTGRKTQLRNDLPEPEIQLHNVGRTPSLAPERGNLTSFKNGATENRPEPEDTRVGAVLNDAQSVGERPPTKTAERAALVDYSEGHYEAIKKAIVSGDISPTQKPVKSQLVRLNVRFVDDAARQKKAVEILDTLAAEGVLIVNPQFGKGGQVVAKYLLNPKRDSIGGEGEELASDPIGEFDITTRCGRCGEYAYTQIDTLMDKQNGVVSCEGCGKNYVAQSHLTNDSNPLTNDLKARAIQSKSIS